MQQPLLSILIPTYNGGSRTLKQVLDSFVTGILMCQTGEIELVISDNASTDNTKTIVEEYLKYPFIRYYRNSSNIGFARNIIKLTDELALGKYGWVVGDDDLISPPSLQYLMNVLLENNLDYISLGFKFIKDISEINQKQTFNFEVTYTSFADSLEHCSYGNILGTFMSSAIFDISKFKNVNKEAISNSFDSYQSIFPNGYVNATAFHNKKCGYITTSIVYPIQHNKEWATSDNNYLISTRIIPALYSYIITLGVKRSELKKTYVQVLHDALIAGYRRIIHKKNVDNNFYRILKISFFYPYAHILVIKTIMKRIF